MLQNWRWHVIFGNWNVHIHNTCLKISMIFTIYDYSDYCLCWKEDIEIKTSIQSHIWTYMCNSELAFMVSKAMNTITFEAALHLALNATNCSNFYPNAIAWSKVTISLFVLSHKCWYNNPADKRNYRKISNIRRTKSQILNVSRLALQWSLCNILKPCVK